ncbi:MAG: hypothetical protein VW600_02620 [Ferrovibrio sp.]
MAVAPSNNLLSALSQLQGTRPAPAPRSPQSTQNASAASQTAPSQRVSFAAQLGGTGNSIQVADQRPATPAPAQAPSRPVQTKGGLLGQHVNILV